jgi:hypothetical protein
MKARWQGELNWNQVLEEACKNAKNCNMTTTPPLKFAKNVHKEKQHEGAHFKL